MLNIQKLEHLCRPLETTPKRLARILEAADDFVTEWELLDPAKPDKIRTVIDVRGILRQLQTRLLRSVLIPKLPISPYSHGGVRGRSIKTNAAPHLGSQFVFATDISNFYPSIHRQRVYRLFVEDLGCSPDVARACTRLCTYENHLALGLVTSPLLADQVLQRIDKRIGAMCEANGLAYTRFVDDVTVSGRFDLEESGIAALMGQILREHGFQDNESKHRFARLDEAAITGVALKGGKFDVTRAYHDELLRQLGDAAALATGQDFAGPFYTRSQIRGRIEFAIWVNRRHQRALLSRFHAVDWDAHGREGQHRGLVARKVQLRSKRPKEGCHAVDAPAPCADVARGAVAIAR